MAGDDNEFLTSEEAAQLLKVPVSTIQQYARTGRLPARKVGRGWRFSRRTLEAWFEDHQAVATDLHHVDT